MTRAGGEADETMVEARNLNQTHVGLAIGINVAAGSTTYARLAGFKISPAAVWLWLDGIPNDEGTLRVEPTTEIWFSQYTQDSMALDLLERIEKQLAGAPRV